MDNYWGVEVLFITILDAVVTEDVITANNTDVNLVETRTVHFLWLWNRHLVWENKQTRLRLPVLANFISCFPPWNITWQFALIPSILKVKRMHRLRVSWKKKTAVQPTEQCLRTMISNYQDSKIKLFNMANISWNKDLECLLITAESVIQSKEI